MAGLYPLSRMQQFDGNGRLLSGARLFLFDGGTSTPRIGYRDSTLTSPHPNPIVADSAGRLPLIYLDDGFYRHRLTSKAGTLIFDDDGLPVLSSTAGGSGTSVDPDSVYRTRDIKIRFDDQPLAGYVRLNGRTIGSASSGATERANADTQSLYEELWSFANIPVTGGKGASAAADFAANKPLVLPNAAGRMLAGMDNMGGGVQNVLTAATSGSTQNPGTVGGAEILTLAVSNLPVSSPWAATASTSITVTGAGSHSHSFGGGTTGIQNVGHTHTIAIASQSIQQGGGNAVSVLIPAAGGTVFTSSDQSQSHLHGFEGVTTADGAHTHAASGATTIAMQPNSGGGQPVNKLAPYITLMIYIRL